MEPVYAERLRRIDALQQALRDGRPRPEKLAAWYGASALLDVEGAPEVVAVNVRDVHEALIRDLGRHTAPTGDMRWLYAALLTARQVDPAAFIRLREVLRTARTASRERRKTGGLYAGGSRAALVLSACGVEAEAGAEAFFEMKTVLNPPWWRADAGITDLYCAAHAAKQDEPRVVAQSRSRAVEVFKSDRRARGHKHAGAKACALFEAEPRTVLRRFLEMDEARKTLKPLRHRVSRSMLMDWAAQGLETRDLHAIAELTEALPRHLGSISTGRSRLAHLIVTHGRAGSEFGEITALAAIIAAQTAAFVATMAATSAATSAAVTSS